MIQHEILARFESAHLHHGGHPDRKNGLCALEWVALLAGERHSDSPSCACPVVAAFVRSWNDSLDDEDRDRLLKPLVPRLVDSRTPEIEKQRSYLALDWMIRTFLPAWLERVDALREHASTIRALSPIESEPAAREAGREVRAAWAAARDAALGLGEANR